MSQPWTHTGAGKAYERVNEHYVEPEWVSQRLFQKEYFSGRIWDPACGFGRIVISALAAGYNAYGSDIADRGWNSTPQDFFRHRSKHDNIVCNPPFDTFRDFAGHALKRARFKVAMIMPTARLNAARWLEGTPLRRVWLLTPRPSMPPGSYLLDGGKVGGGKSDYVWLVWDHDYIGAPELMWLKRGDKSDVQRDDYKRQVGDVP